MTLNQSELALRVRGASRHQIRAGTTHRFIDNSFVTVGDRVFCRRYSFGEPSWHSAFQSDPAGQISLDNAIFDVFGRIPADLDEINGAVNEAYITKLTQQGARSWISWVQNPEVMASTLEICIR